MKTKLLLAVGVALALALSWSGPGRATTPINLVRTDVTFGTDGIKTVDVAGRGPGGPNTDHEDEPYWSALQPDGLMVVVGKAFNDRTGNIDFAVLRFRPDGSLDPAFGWYGIVLIDFAGERDEALSVAIQPDGKIVLAGLAGRANGNSDFGLARLNPNGSRDVTFGWNGIVMTDFFGQRDQALGVVLLPDGKIVAGGYATRASTGSDLALARYNSNGSLDKTFGVGGLSIADYWGKTDAMYKLAMQPDGKLVGSGVATRPDGTTDFAVARFNVDGAPDATFGWGGRVATDFFGQSDLGLSLLLLPDGKLIAGGLAFNPATNSQDLALAKYNANGSVDTSFAPGTRPGQVVVDYFGLYDQALWLIQQPDGKILALGHAKSPATSVDFALARFTPGGLLDVSFGVGGRATKDFFGGPDGMHTGIMFPDGTLTGMGDAYNPATDSDDFALTRWLIADPSWISGVVSALPSTSFAGGQLASVLSALTAAQNAVLSGDTASARAALGGLRTHLDGCGTSADADDWIVRCPDQQQVRTLVDQVIAKLAAP